MSDIDDDGTSGRPPVDVTAPPADPGRDRVRDAERVLHGEEGSGAWKQLLYVVYVATILSGLYGFTVLRAVVEVVGPRWRAAGLVPTVVGAAIAVAALVTVLGHLAGRRRGPVTPDLAWVDLVVSSSVDRRLALREAWALPFTALLAGGTVAGLVIGGSVWGGGAGGPVSLPAGLVLGTVYGATTAVVWLAGQLAADPAAARPGSVGAALRDAARPRRALRLLGVEGLRAHSARSSRLGGAALAGDPRALRLEAASPVRRGRHLRLRPRGAFGTVVARDLLGLRRQPLLLVGGVLLVALGATVLGWYLVEPAAPFAVAALGVLVTHLGGAATGEGVRLLGDTLGAPRLLGGSVRREAVAHSVVPATVLVAVGLLGVLPWTAGRGALLSGVVLVVLVAAGSLSAQWISAFRVLPPSWSLLPEAGPQILVAWLAWPVLLAVAGGTVLAVRVAGVVQGAAPAAAVVPVAAVLAVLGSLANRALNRAAVAHRD